MSKSKYTMEDKKVFKAMAEAVKKNLPSEFCKDVAKMTGKKLQRVRDASSGRRVDYDVLAAMQKIANKKKRQVEKLKAELNK